MNSLHMSMSCILIKLWLSYFFSCYGGARAGLLLKLLVWLRVDNGDVSCGKCNTTFSAPVFKDGEPEEAGEPCAAGLLGDAVAEAMAGSAGSRSGETILCGRRTRTLPSENRLLVLLLLSPSTMYDKSAMKARDAGEPASGAHASIYDSSSGLYNDCGEPTNDMMGALRDASFRSVRLAERMDGDSDGEADADELSRFGCERADGGTDTLPSST